MAVATPPLLAMCRIRRAVMLPLCFILIQVLPACADDGTEQPITGREVPALKPFDDLLQTFLAEKALPGASVAIVRHGTVIYSRGFGYADTTGGIAVRPDSLFRIASISKPITAVAIFTLAEAGKLHLDDKVSNLLDLRIGPNGDSRLGLITILDLLHHSGGWDRDHTFDPMFHSNAICSELHVPRPARPQDIIDYMWNRSLAFDPGSTYVYSNFGYCLLSRIIEHVSGVGYETYVKAHVLRPLGIEHMRLGRTLLEGADPHEVRYYTRSEETGPSVFPDSDNAQVPLPYGTFCLESMDSHGGWLASADELARFAAAFVDAEHCPVLRADSIRRMFGRPAGDLGSNVDGSAKPAFYACGWMVRPIGEQGSCNAWHTGSLPGSSTLMVKRSDGICWTVLFNSRDSSDGADPASLIDSRMHQAAARVTDWP